MRNIKFLKTIAMAMILVMLCGSFAFAAVPADVAGSAQKEAITALFEAGVLQGSDDGLFHPFDNLTRAQACVIIVRAIDPPTAELEGTPTQKLAPSGFPDMRGYNWADKFVSFAVKHGIVNGYPDGTFKPGDNVTCNEMLTMVLRAIGFTDAATGSNWPAAFIEKAKEEGVTAGLSEELPDLATREIAARMAYNKLDELRAIGEAMEETGETGSGETDSGSTMTWNVKDLVFGTGAFDRNMTAFGGTSLSKDVAVYTFGVKNDYKKDMKLPTKESDYRKDTIHKYKNTTTPAFYIKRGNEITLMVLPMDSGFTGRIYAVINEMTAATNGKGENVNNIYTLAAGRQVTWLTKDTNITVPDSSEYLAGELYELRSSGGIIMDKPRKHSDSGINEDFIEMTVSGDKKDGWATVTSFSEGIVTLSSDNKFTVADDAVIYVLNSDGKSYKVGRPSDLRKDAKIRAFSIDGGDIASFITVKNR